MDILENFSKISIVKNKGQSGAPVEVFTEKAPISRKKSSLLDVKPQPRKSLLDVRQATSTASNKPLKKNMSIIQDLSDESIKSEDPEVVVVEEEAKTQKNNTFEDEIEITPESKQQHFYTQDP